jgi:DNA-binding response OmpR family regulator
MDMTQARILVVDDNAKIRSFLEQLLHMQGFAVWLAARGEEGLELFRRQGADLVLLDVQIPGALDGPRLFTELRKCDPAVRCYFMSGETGLYQPLDLIMMGALDVIRKPFNVPGLVQLIRRTLEKELAASR